MTDFAPFHAGTARPGGHAWINGKPYSFLPPRGHVAVEEDGSFHFYRASRSERGAFRRWAINVFAGMSRRRLIGAWPSYRVVS